MRGGGNADQAPAIAAVNSGGVPIIDVALKPHGVSTGQHLLVNDRVGPLDTVVATGMYCLHGEFGISAVQPPTGCPHPLPSPGAGANFDTDPKFDSRYSNILKTFRAVPHQDFGFTVLVHVNEAGANEEDILPFPRPAERPGPPPTVPSGEKKK